MKNQDLDASNHCAFSIQAHLVIITKQNKTGINSPPNQDDL